MILVCIALIFTKRITTDRMDRLPCKLIYHILRYIDQLLDLFRISYICKHWRSFKRSQQLIAAVGFLYLNDYERRWMLNIDRSLFPVNLRSTENWFLSWTVPIHSYHYESLLGHYYPFTILLGYCKMVFFSPGPDPDLFLNVYKLDISVFESMLI